MCIYIYTYIYTYIWLSRARGSEGGKSNVSKGQAEAPAAKKNSIRKTVISYKGRGRETHGSKVLSQHKPALTIIFIT